MKKKVLIKICSMYLIFNQQFITKGSLLETTASNDLRNVSLSEKEKSVNNGLKNLIV